MVAMSEAAATPIPRRGRVFVIAALALVLLALGYFVVETATREAGSDVVRVAGIEESQEIFGGVPQEGDRLGSSDAPVSVQIFTDLQCSTCRDDFLGIVPGLTEDFARPGDAQLLMRHYSVAENELELGFYGAEAAAQQGYGWQYTYLFFRNQDEAEKFGIDEDFLESLAGSIGELDVEEWRDYLDREGGTDGAITTKLQGYEELGTELGIRAGLAAIVTGPEGTRTLQDGPSLGQVERAIEAVN
jgi:protein-disulfide isomerase